MRIGLKPNSRRISGVFLFLVSCYNTLTQTKSRPIDYFANPLSRYAKNNKKKTVHLYGGEPMLNPEAVIAATLRVNKLKKTGELPENCEVAIVTNGTLLNEKFIEFFAQNNVSVGLSLDGPAHITNKYRIARKNDIDVFKKIRKSYELLIKHNVKTGFSATLTPESLKIFDEVVSFFTNEIGIQDGICFNILHFNPKVNVDEEYYQNAASCLIKSFSFLREKGIYEERMMRKAKAFAFRDPMFADCSVNGSQVVIAPDGRVGVCQDFVKPRTYFGKTIGDNYDPFEEGLFDNWKRRSPFFMEQCYNCEAIGICGGGCPASVELKTGNRWNIDERICPHSKSALEWLIWDTYFNLKKKEEV